MTLHNVYNESSTSNVSACRNNVLIGPDGTAKLTDFGVSAIMTNNTDTTLSPGPNDTCALTCHSSF